MGKKIKKSAKKKVKAKEQPSGCNAPWCNCNYHF